MARVSRYDKLTDHERLRLVWMIGEGVPWEKLAAEFGISQGTIFEWAKRNGYQRSPSAAKRKMVEDLLVNPETEWRKWGI